MVQPERPGNPNRWEDDIRPCYLRDLLLNLRRVNLIPK